MNGAKKAEDKSFLHCSLLLCLFNALWFLELVVRMPSVVDKEMVVDVQIHACVQCTFP